MDAKEILRQMIRHRFWIVVGIAFLMPIIGYFVTAGAVKSETEAKATEIKTAKEGAQAYTSGTVPNGQYSQFTKEKISLVEGDVNEAHRRLYQRQAPLLDWPEEVAPQMTSWGRDIPEDVPPNELDAVSFVYTEVYDEYADNVFKVVNPWDPITGEGIVVTPPKESLLQTVTFNINDLPSIAKVWQYQENLWVRRSILEVIAGVNKKAGATDWETAPIKQINRLDVGNTTAVDHQTAAKGFELKDPPEVKKGGQALEPEEPASSAGGAGGMTGMAGMDRGGMESQMMSMMSGGAMMGSSGMSGMGGMPAGGGPVRFLQQAGAEDLFRDYPAFVSVLIDQNSIQNFLVEFENSPMSMRVLEANWTRPKTRVQPPVKGQGFAGYGMGSFGIGAGGGLYGMGMDPGMMMSMMGSGQAMMGRMGDMGMEASMMRSMMGGGRGMMGGGRGMSMSPPRSKVKRDLNKEQEKGKAEEADPTKVTIYDPYYNVVELQVYVQARFFYPPAAEEPAEPTSEGDLAPADDPVAAGATADPAAEAAPPADAAPAEATDAVPVDAAPAEAVTPDSAATPPAPAEGEAAPAPEAGTGDTPATAPAEAGTPADAEAPAPPAGPEATEPAPQPEPSQP